MKFLILGPHSCGKDTVADYLSDAHGFTYAGSTSGILCEILYKFVRTYTSKSFKFYVATSSKTMAEIDELISLVAKHHVEIKEFSHVSLLYVSRHKFSRLLYLYGKLLKQNLGLLHLVDALLARSTEIVAGLRETDEMVLAIAKYQPEYIFWIDRDVDIDPTLEFSRYDVANACKKANILNRFHTIENNSSLSKLYAYIDFLIG